MWSGFEKTAPAPESNRRRAVSTYRVVDRAADAWSGSQNVRLRSRVNGRGVGGPTRKGEACVMWCVRHPARFSTRRGRARRREGDSTCDLTSFARATAPFAVPDAPFGVGRGELHWRGHPTDRASAPRESEGSRAKYCITEQQKKSPKPLKKHALHTTKPVCTP